MSICIQARFHIPNKFLKRRRKRLVLFPHQNAAIHKRRLQRAKAQILICIRHLHRNRNPYAASHVRKYCNTRNSIEFVLPPLQMFQSFFALLPVGHHHRHKVPKRLGMVRVDKMRKLVQHHIFYGTLRRFD